MEYITAIELRPGDLVNTSLGKAEIVEAIKELTWLPDDPGERDRIMHGGFEIFCGRYVSSMTATVKYLEGRAKGKTSMPKPFNVNYLFQKV